MPTLAHQFVTPANCSCAFISSSRALEGIVRSRLGSAWLVPLLAVVRYEDLVVLKELAEAGKLSPVTDRTYPLSEAADAVRYLGSRSSPGQSRHQRELKEGKRTPTQVSVSCLRIVASLTRPEPAWTPQGVVIYLATLAPFVLLFVGAAIGWTIAPLEHLRPTPQNVAGGAATFVVGLMIVRWRWGTRHVVRPSSTVAPEFEPPDGLRPAEADVLLHGKPRRRDVIATVVDLALRDFIRIDERSEGDGPPTWVFERTGASIGELREYERKTLAGLFSHGPTVKLADLEPRFFVAADLIEEELEREVVRRGWFADPPARLRSRWATAGWVRPFRLVPRGAALFGFIEEGLPMTRRPSCAN